MYVYVRKLSEEAGGNFRCYGRKGDANLLLDKAGLSSPKMFVFFKIRGHFVLDNERDHFQTLYVFNVRKINVG